MKKILIFVLVALLLGACSDKPGENANQSNNSRSEAIAPETQDKAKVGDTVLYQSNSGQRFYEAKVSSIEGTRVKLDDEVRKETAEREVAEIYAIPKAGSKVTVKPGDIIAARYGQSSVWEAAEVVQVGDKILVKGLSSMSGSTREVLPEHILTLSPAVAARVKASFSTKSK